MGVFVIGRRGFGGCKLGAVPLGRSHGFDIGPEAGKRGGNFLLAGDEVFIEKLFAGR